MMVRPIYEHVDPVVIRRIAINALAKPVVSAARAEASAAIRTGVIKRPGCCPVCAAMIADGLAPPKSKRPGCVQAHHESYLRPLAISWLCQAHHATRHRVLRRMDRDPRENIGRLVLRNMQALCLIAARLGFSEAA